MDEFSMITQLLELACYLLGALITLMIGVLWCAFHISARIDAIHDAAVDSYASEPFDTMEEKP